MVLSNKPTIYWLEGLLNYFNVKFPYKEKHQRTVGFDIGRNIVGLYLAEILLKYALEKYNVKHSNTHNLYKLFKCLPPDTRLDTSRKYKEILNLRTSQTFSYARSLVSLFKYLGENPIKDARYFGFRSDDSKPINLSPEKLYPLVNSLFIVLHGYPQESNPSTRRYNTRFVKFRKSKSKQIGTILTFDWAEGILDYFNVPSEFEETDFRRVGFTIGQQIVGFYIVELLLKYKLSDLRITYKRNHNLITLYQSIPDRLRTKSEREYLEIRSDFMIEDWDFTKSISSLISYYGPDPITESRYFWESFENRTDSASIVFSWNILCPMIYAFFVALLDYPKSTIPIQREALILRYNKGIHKHTLSHDTTS